MNMHDIIETVRENHLVKIFVVMLVIGIAYNIVIGVIQQRSFEEHANDTESEKIVLVNDDGTKTIVDKDDYARALREYSE